MVYALILLSSWEYDLPVKGKKYDEIIKNLKKRNIEDAARKCCGVVEAILDFTRSELCAVVDAAAMGRISLQAPMQRRLTDIDGQGDNQMPHEQTRPNAGGFSEFQLFQRPQAEFDHHVPNSARRRQKARGDRDVVHSGPKRRRVELDRRLSRTNGDNDSSAEAVPYAFSLSTADQPLQRRGFLPAAHDGQSETDAGGVGT